MIAHSEDADVIDNVGPENVLDGIADVNEKS